MFRFPKFIITFLATAAHSAEIDHPDCDPINPVSTELAIFHKKEVPYNHNQHEVKQFLEKLRQTKTPIRNDSKHPVRLRLSLIGDSERYQEKHTLLPGQTFVTYKSDILVDIKLYDKAIFMNLEQGSKKYTVSLSNTEIPYRPTFIEYADFRPVFFKPDAGKNPLLFPYSPVYGAVNIPTNLSPSFQDQYDGNLRYIIDCQFRHEGIDGMAFFDHLTDLYKRHYFPTLYNRLVRKGVPLTLEHSKIPGIIHSIWLTHKDKPIEFPEEFIQYALDSFKACPTEEGYKHILWVQSKKRLPHTVKRLKDSGIKVKEYKKLGDFKLKVKLKEELKKKKFGRASDILRVEILERMGGIYRDTDYRIHHSLTPLLLSYNFIAAREPMSSFICNAFIATSPGHPTIKALKDLIIRNYDPHRAPDYIKHIPDSDGFATILITGPGAFTTAIAKTIGQGDERDVILPHQYIYPTPVDIYPQLTVIKPRDSVPAIAFGAHYWLSSWTTLSTFGSEG
ncbi:MAG: hypothetical protein KF798_05085 [Candidatus Paracaedibacteraceae bacterium]|nr:hypothetical protein [Candidatus Paracaedibacteraceae bacterium]